jgi:hypothetical protein
MDKSVVTPDDVVRARACLAEIYRAEQSIPGSPVSDELIRLNLDHTDRVHYTIQAIAEGEGLDSPLLELAAVLHDVAKLDHRDIASGGIDTWHHHHRGAATARKFVLADLGKIGRVADHIAAMIDRHSDIPFIRRFWLNVYGASLPSPRTPEDFALRDADALDVLWVGGLDKIVRFRQIQGTAFYGEDGGDVQKAIASARTSFAEAAELLEFGTARSLAAPRIATAEAFYDEVSAVESLAEFNEAYGAFLKRLGFPEAAVLLGRPASNLPILAHP